MSLEKEVRELRKEVRELLDLVKNTGAIEWMDIKMFCQATGKTKPQVQHLVKKHPHLMRVRNSYFDTTINKTRNVGVEYSIVEYNKLFKPVLQMNTAA